MQLTKYIAASGIATRREASQLIKDGKVSVNSSICKEPFYEVAPTDVIVYKGKEVHQIAEYVYFLVNKPKGTSTTLEDGMIHISTLVSKKTSHAVNPIDHLDNNDLGLVVLTNDHELIERVRANKKVRSTYHLFLDNPWTEKTSLNTKEYYVPLEKTEFPECTIKIETTLSIPELKKCLLNSKIGFTKVDRLVYGGLTKKDLPRGWNRPLTEKEIIFLKHFS
jgi:23S rRNA pseudouridine2605 synthase